MSAVQNDVHGMRLGSADSRPRRLRDPGVPGRRSDPDRRIVPTGVGLPATFASTGPEPLAFSQSPATPPNCSASARPGLRWAGYVSAVTGYAP